MSCLGHPDGSLAQCKGAYDNGQVSVATIAFNHVIFATEVSIFLRITISYHTFVLSFTYSIFGY